MKNPIFSVLNDVRTVNFSDLIIDETVLDDFSKNEISSALENQKLVESEQDLIEKIYIEGECIIAYEMKTNASNFKYTFPKYLEEQILYLRSITIKESGEKSLDGLLERVRSDKYRNQFGVHSSEFFQDIQQKINNQMGLKLSDFFKNVYCIESEKFSEINITQFISHKGLRPIYTELRGLHGNEVSLFRSLKVEKMYFKNALFIACKLKHNEFGDEFFYWTEDYREALSCRDWEYNRTNS